MYVAKVCSPFALSTHDQCFLIDFLITHSNTSAVLIQISFTKYIELSFEPLTNILKTSLVYYILSYSIGDGFQPKTSPFSTYHLIRVNYKVLSQLSQSVFLFFSYFNSARHNLAIELCHALKNI